MINKQIAKNLKISIDDDNFEQDGALYFLDIPSLCLEMHLNRTEMDILESKLKERKNLRKRTSPGERSDSIKSKISEDIKFEILGGYEGYREESGTLGFSNLKKDYCEIMLEKEELDNLQEALELRKFRNE